MSPIIKTCKKTFVTINFTVYIYIIHWYVTNTYKWSQTLLQGVFTLNYIYHMSHGFELSFHHATHQISCISQVICNIKFSENIIFINAFKFHPFMDNS